MAIMENSRIMRHGDQGHYYKVVRKLIINQPNLLINEEVVARYFFEMKYVGRIHQKLPKNVQ